MYALGLKVSLYWAPVIISILGIFLLSNTTASALEPITRENRILPYVVSKVITSQFFVHPLEFGILTAATYRLLVSYQAVPFRLAVIITLVWALFNAFLDEFHQSFVSGRASTLSDVGLDATGSILALALVLVLRPYIRFLIPR